MLPPLLRIAGGAGRREKVRERERTSGEKEAEEEEECDSGRGWLSANGSSEGEEKKNKSSRSRTIYILSMRGKLHYCSHAQSYCPHSRWRPLGQGEEEGEVGGREEGGEAVVTVGRERWRYKKKKADEEKKSDVK